MKRFYCTVCKKFKRVRKMPKRIIGANEVQPGHRLGQCNWHYVSTDNRKKAV